MIPTKRRIIELEIEEAERIYGSNWERAFFNNFHGNLPGGWRRKVDDEILDRKPAIGLRLGKTLREFFGDVDRVLGELGIDVVGIEQLQINSRTEEVLRKARPTYVALRVSGYTHYDLTG
ncbi:MAG: hypothetical protein HYS32_04310 [Candidatus Woesearchaeota archaeon]|nr:MAG: hypothetical protein HYS32_04310 [Candidatus Woesearchaeota archaeon]